jgi:hypothetical protein
MKNLLELYQKYNSYSITDVVQELDFPIDIERLRIELFDFIIKNNYGMSAVSLRLQKDKTDYVSEDYKLENEGQAFYLYKNNISTDIDSEFIHWHPDLKYSYTASLVPKLEKFCGFPISKVRLAWLQPEKGYSMHVDFEPMRIHIPIFTNDLAYILHDQKLFNMKYGKVYHLITPRIHTAWNFGRLPRLHLIFSTYACGELKQEIDQLRSDEFREKIFIETIKNQGVDLYSLTKLLQLDSDKTGKMSESWFGIKKVLDLIQKYQDINK